MNDEFFTEFLNLIKSMLTTDINKRISIDNALNHK